MTLEQVFTLLNAGYTKDEINAFTPVQVQQTPIQQTPIQQTPIQQTPIQQTPIQQTPIQQTPIQQTPIQQTPAQQTPIQQTPIQQTPAQAQPLNQPVNAAGTTERLLNIIEELQRSNLRLASGQGATPEDTAEDALLSIIQETKGGKA